MDLREIIKKAKQAAKSPDEVLLPERFEEYLDLLELSTQVTQKERFEFQSKLKQSFASLKEVAERVARSYGMDPAILMETFMNPQNIGIELKQSIQSIQRHMNEPLEVPRTSQAFKKRKNKNLRV